MPRNCWTRCNKTFPCSFPAREKTREIESRETSKRLEKQAILALLRKMIYKLLFTPAIRLGVLLSSAAALPISRWYSLISVYRNTHQCGERSNAAFRRQSAANLTSLAPHDSKARLQIGHELQGFMAKPCTPHLHCAARAVLQD